MVSVVDVPELSSLVGGREIRGGHLASDLNPSRPSEEIAAYFCAERATAELAVAAAREAFGPWATTPAPARGGILRRIADLIERDLTSLARSLALEEGKTLAEAIGETRRAADIFRYFASKTLDPDGLTYPSHTPRVSLSASRRPIGVISIITPWNFPLAIPAWKIAPALAYGNTVVWKSADLVPLTSWHLAKLFAEAGLPDGVLNLIVGRGADVGEILVSGSVNGVSFTGSNVVGQLIRLRAAAHGVACQLEMGGSNPAVVLRDADIGFAAEQIARSAFLSTGQRCTATSRVIVESTVHDALIEAIESVASGWRVGDALDEATDIGPLASLQRLEEVSRLIERSKVRGARTVVPRADVADGPGYFLAPHVLVGDDAGPVVGDEEIFGPVVEVRAASGYSEAIEMANSTRFGLVASLFTADLERAADFVRDAQAGVVKVNQESTGLEFHVPFGGTKESSGGPKEQGNAAVEFFTSWKTAYVASPPARATGVRDDR